MSLIDTEFYVNIDAVIAASERIGSTFTRLGNMIESHMYGVVKDIIYQEFEAAAEIADSDDGFPDRYKQHMLEAVRENIYPTVLMNGDELFISFDIEESLGGLDDLQRAFHQGAQLAGGGKLWGEYTGQALKNDDPAERHVFWEALRYGADKVDIKGKSVHIRDSSWEETLEQYLRIWGEKAPQWILIQFGQEEWEPTVPQVDIFNNIKRAIRDYSSFYLASVLEAEVAVANAYRATGLEVGFSGDKTPARVISGTTTINGKTYRPGRFAPRAGLG